MEFRVRVRIRYRWYCDFILLWPTPLTLLSTWLWSGRGDVNLWGFMGCVCNIAIINQRFGATYLSIQVNDRFSTFRTLNLSLCNTLQFLQEAKENILCAKVFPFWKTWSSLCGSSAVLHCITLPKIFTFLRLSLADVRGDHFVEPASFQLILFLDHALGLECCYKRWRWNCSVSTADRLTISKLKMWVKYSSDMEIMW